MKHAFLIMAHNEFEILRKLLLILDDVRNDIYVHFDKKVVEPPKIEVKKARLFILSNRIDVRWGDVSQIEAEFVLFQAAYKNGPYAYYHTLSGVDFVLKSQDYFHAFFEEHQSKEFIGYTQGDIENEIDRKVKYIHLFSRSFRSEKGMMCFFKKGIRYLFLRVQFLLRICQNKHINFKKGTSWVSITHNLVGYILPQFNDVMKIYAHTFCADEIFLHTLCWNSPFRKSLYSIDNEQIGCMRMIGWRENQLVDWTDRDFEVLINSDALFARKFNTKNIEVVDRILNSIASYA